MNRIFLFLIACVFISNSYASLPLPSVVPNATPGGSF
jgi:hypothetical protein